MDQLADGIPMKMAGAAQLRHSQERPSGDMQKNALPRKPYTCEWNSRVAKTSHHANAGVLYLKKRFFDSAIGAL